MTKQQENSTEKSRMEIEKMTSEDLQEQIKNIQEDLKVFDSKADEVCKRLGMTRGELKKYIENPSNFSPVEWETMQSVKADLDAFKDSIAKALNVPTEGDDDKKNTTKSLDKKPRFVGMKKQSWIPMS